MTTVYVVTSGDYSDYGIEAVFLAEGLADAFVAARARPDGRPSEFDIEVWEADPADPAGERARQGQSVWRVEMNREGGVPEAPVNIGVGRNESDYLCARVYRELLTSIAWARDEQHAVKIANERRAQMIASGEWTVNEIPR